MLDECPPDAIKVRRGMDRPNARGIASPYEAFEPAEARCLAERLEIHFTPKRGGGLNRNRGAKTISRQFTTPEAEIGSRRLYPNSAPSDCAWRYGANETRARLDARKPGPGIAAPLSTAGGSGRGMPDGREAKTGAMLAEYERLRARQILYGAGRRDLFQGARHVLDGGSLDDPGATRRLPGWTAKRTGV
jgi:hypothetical protein